MESWLITQRLELNIYGHRIDTLEQNYIKYFSQLGIDLKVVPNIVSGNKFIAFDGFIFSGGGELPNRFLSEPILSEKENDLAEHRYKIQTSILKNAVSENKKVIGICYGMQLILAYYGAEIQVDIHKGKDDRKPPTDHAITVSSNSMTQDQTWVNGYHNQGIFTDDVPKSFDIIATDKKYNVCEAISHKQHRILGIQWHPERNSPDMKFNKSLIQNHLNA